MLFGSAVDYIGQRELEEVVRNIGLINFKIGYCAPLYKSTMSINDEGKDSPVAYTCICKLPTQQMEQYLPSLSANIAHLPSQVLHRFLQSRVRGRRC